MLADLPSVVKQRADMIVASKFFISVFQGTIVLPTTFDGEGVQSTDFTRATLVWVLVPAAFRGPTHRLTGVPWSNTSLPFMSHSGGLLYVPIASRHLKP